MGKIRKKQKDPLAPKKPIGPYLEFAKEERVKVLAELGSMTIGEVGKELGKRWKNLPLEQKEKFLERGRQNALKYKSEMKEFKEKGGAPKKPLSPYMEFAKVERPQVLAELGSLSIGEVGKELGRRWKALPQIQKEKFVEIGKENAENYVKELAVFSQAASVNSSITSLSSSQDSSLQSVDAPAAIVEDEPIQLTPVAQEESSSTTTDPSPMPEDVPILTSDLGFAKQRFYPWHPALKTGMLARGSRISVTYFGTAETGTVDKVKWVPYSKQSASRICSPHLLKKASFKKGLTQLKAMLEKIKSGGQRVTKTSGVGFSEQPAGRKLVKLSKEGLQKDEEQNLRMMKEKILQIEEKQFKWGCRDCSWKGKFLHKAKLHARDCGTRRRENKRKPKVKKYECSGAGCTLAFPYLSQLQKHYR